MKKVLVILLTMAMIFTTFACGDKEKEPQGQGDIVENLKIVYEGEDGTVIYLTEDDRYIDKDGNEVNIEDYIQEEEEEDGEETEFNLDISKTFAFDDLLDKRDLSDMSKLQDPIYNDFDKLTKKVFGTEFELEASYEEGGDDKVVGAYGYEKGNVDLKNMETGIYLSGETGESDYYISYSSELSYDASDATISKLITELHSAFGITLSREKFTEGINNIMSKSADEISDAYRYEILEKDRDLYTDTVSFCITGCMSNDKPCWYVGVEIDRVYR